MTTRLGDMHGDNLAGLPSFQEPAQPNRPLTPPAFFDGDQDEAIALLAHGEANLVTRCKAVEQLRIFGLEGHSHGFHQAGDVLVLDENPVDFGGDHPHNAKGGPALTSGLTCRRPSAPGGDLTSKAPDLCSPPDGSQQKPDAYRQVYQ